MLSNKSRSIFEIYLKISTFEKLCNFCFVILPSTILLSIIHGHYFQISFTCNMTQQ